MNANPDKVQISDGISAKLTDNGPEKDAVLTSQGVSYEYMHLEEGPDPNKSRRKKRKPRIAFSNLIIGSSCLDAGDYAMSTRMRTISAIPPPKNAVFPVTESSTRMNEVTHHLPEIEQIDQ